MTKELILDPLFITGSAEQQSDNGSATKDIARHITGCLVCGEERSGEELSSFAFGLGAKIEMMAPCPRVAFIEIQSPDVSAARMNFFFPNYRLCYSCTNSTTQILLLPFS